MTIFGMFGTVFTFLVHLVHFGTLDVWYTGWYITPVGSLLIILLFRSLLVIFGTFGTVGTFGTPVTFGTLRIRSTFSTLGIIPSEFWYIWCTLVHFTFGTSVGTLH